MGQITMPNIKLFVSNLVILMLQNKCYFYLFLILAKQFGNNY